MEQIFYCALQVQPTLLNDQSYLRFLVEEHVMTSDLPPSASHSKRSVLLSPGSSRESSDMWGGSPQMHSRSSSKSVLLRKSGKTEKKSDVTVFR